MGWLRMGRFACGKPTLNEFPFVGVIYIFNLGWFDVIGERHRIRRYERVMAFWGEKTSSALDTGVESLCFTKFSDRGSVDIGCKALCE
jgi:hypothetical protein